MTTSITIFKRQKVLDLIDAFNELFPEAQDGLAHIVLADQNLTDEDLQSTRWKLAEPGNDPLQIVSSFIRVLEAIPDEFRDVHERLEVTDD
jgi:hypothetical protein